MELQNITIEKAHQGLRKKEFSAAELTRAYLDRIEKNDKKIHAFLDVYREEASAQAATIDKKIAAGAELPPLAGIPVAVKDNILVEGTRTTAASRILENYTAPYDATCIARLKEQGVVILGKTNLDEFAMGSSTENSAFGPTRNPHDLDRVPGGSSGGSAAAVGGDLCVFSLGSDTGGSIRQPASFCGVVGLKPTYGAVSRYGLIAFASSLDQIGPLTKNIQDARIVFDIIKGRDPEDSTSFEPDSLNSFKNKAIKDLVIGVPREYFIEGTDPAVIELVKKAIERYQKAGAVISEISLPYTDYALPCYYIIAPSEASANLARFDGIKYGLSKTKEAVDLMEVYLKSRGEGFGPEVRRRIMLGTYALSSGYYEAYYVRSRKIKKLIEHDFNKAFEKVDVIMSPVCPTTAFKIGERAEDPLQMYLSDIFTVSVNLAGLPAISFPCGEVAGLPVGLQIIGRHWDENKIFRTAEAFEKGEI